MCGPRKNMKRIKQDPTKVSRLSRSARRAIIAAALVVATPVLADEPAKTSVRILPPPVLDAPISAVQQVALHQNPYCGPELRPISDPNVKLASNRQPSVRLKGRKSEVGLVPIGTQANLSVPVKVRPQALRIQTPEVPSVQSNPLIDSLHHANPNLIDTNVTMPNERLEELELTRRGADLAPAVRIAPHSGQQHDSGLQARVTSTPKMVLQPISKAPAVVGIPVSQAPVIQAPVSEIPALEKAGIQNATVAAEQDTEGATPQPVVDQTIELVATPSATQPVPEAVELEKVGQSPATAAQVEETATVEPETQEPELAAAPAKGPVTFSMSDSEDADTLSPSDMTEEPDEADLSPAEPVQLAEAEPVEVAEPVNLTELQPIKRHDKDNSVEDLRPLAKNDASSPSPVVQDPVQSTIKMLDNPRYRAPVAVAAPPLSIASQNPTAPTVQPAAPVRGLQVNSPAKQANLRKAPTRLHITKAQVRSLTIGGHVRRIDVGDQGVCQAIATGPNQLKLIGTGNGVTRLVVWADTKNSPTRVRTFEIHVEDVVETTGASLKGKTRMLNDSILHMFPNADISVQQERDRLIVAGDCDSEAEAKKIIRMVRKTCLIPVRDEIKVR